MKKVFPLSFSRLSSFETCEARFEFLYVTKQVKDLGNRFTEHGYKVHSALEQHGKALTGNATEAAIVALEEDQYPLEVRPWLPLVQRIVEKPGEKYFELQLALRHDRTPCDWFAPDVWLRSILDVLVIDGRTAFVIDWKTGKVKGNPSQLQLFAAMVFARFPEVEEVKTMFVWLAHDQTTVETYSRQQAETIWNALLPRFNRVQEAVDLGVFKASPSPLCKWCPARSVCGDAR